MLRLVRVGVEMVDARGVERGRAPLDAVDDVALCEQQLGEIGAVLAGHAGNQRDFLRHQPVRSCGKEWANPDADFRVGYRLLLQMRGKNANLFCRAAVLDCSWPVRLVFQSFQMGGDLSARGSSKLVRAPIQASPGPSVRRRPSDRSRAQTGNGIGIGRGQSPASIFARCRREFTGIGRPEQLGQFDRTEGD